MSGLSTGPPPGNAAAPDQRAEGEQAGDRADAPHTIADRASIAGDLPIERKPIRRRRRTERTTLGRTAHAECFRCRAVWHHAFALAAAAQHTRATGHPTTGAYAARYRYELAADRSGGGP